MAPQGAAEVAACSATRHERASERLDPAHPAKRPSTDEVLVSRLVSCRLLRHPGAMSAPNAWLVSLLAGLGWVIGSALVDARTLEGAVDQARAHRDAPVVLIVLIIRDVLQSPRLGCEARGARPRDRHNATNGKDVVEGSL